MRYFLLILFITLQASFLSYAKEQSDSYTSNQIIYSELKLLLWNIKKGSKSNWHEDMSTLLNNQDLILLQEAHLTQNVLNTINIDGYDWQMGKTFDFKGCATGVLTLSNIEPSTTKLLLSKPKEPITKTPKATLISFYQIEKSNKRLMVINTHGINFVTTKSYGLQMEAIALEIKKHHGPLLWAGDFNTWSKKRLEKVLAITEMASLIQVQFPQGLLSSSPLPWSNLPLDHIFYRDLILNQATVMTEIESSDHFPIEATFSIIK